MTHVEWMALARWLVPMILSYLTGHGIGYSNGVNKGGDQPATPPVPPSVP